MDLYPLDPPDLLRPGPVDRGWTRTLYRGPRSIAEILADASKAMDAEDEAQERGS
jgi:hypothetical protein